jgi:hypothetical protein
MIGVVRVLIFLPGCGGKTVDDANAVQTATWQTKE